MLSFCCLCASWVWLWVLTSRSADCSGAWVCCKRNVLWTILSDWVICTCIETNSVSVLVYDCRWVKGIVHFEFNFWNVLVYLKGIQDVVVFVSTVFSILIILGQTVVVCQSYNAGLWSPPQRERTEKSKLNMI